MKLRIGTASAMERLGAYLAHAITPGLVVNLKGELGVGKTTLARGFVKALGWDGVVKSPTYTLIETYELPSVAVYHFDLYRLSDPDELLFLGADDYLSGQGICLIEWPERAVDYLPTPDISVHLAYDRLDRRVELLANSSAGHRALSALPSDMTLEKNNLSI